MPRTATGIYVNSLKFALRFQLFLRTSKPWGVNFPCCLPAQTVYFFCLVVVARNIIPKQPSAISSPSYRSHAFTGGDEIIFSRSFYCYCIGVHTCTHAYCMRLHEALLWLRICSSLHLPSKWRWSDIRVVAWASGVQIDNDAVANEFSFWLLFASRTASYGSACGVCLDSEQRNRNHPSALNTCCTIVPAVAAHNSLCCTWEIHTGMEKEREREGGGDTKWFEAVNFLCVGQIRHTRIIRVHSVL